MMNPKQKEVINKPKVASFLSLFLLLIATIVGSLLVGFILQKNQYTLPFDSFFYHLFISLPHPQWLNTLIWPFDNNFIALFAPHPSYLVLMYAGFFGYILLFKRKSLRWAVISIVLGLLLSFIFVKIDTYLVFRQRPFFILPNHVTDLVKESLRHWTSYPSGHTRDTAMLAIIIGSYMPKSRILLIALALFVGFSRVYLGVHFPTDVISGFAIGVCAGLLAVRFVDQLQHRFQRSK